jgi:putative membrane protein
MRVFIRLTLGFATAGLLVSVSQAQPPLPTPDQIFVHKAAQGGIAEVELSQLAATRSSSDSIKDFASHMVQAHSDNNAKLQQIAQADGIAVPSETDADHSTLRTQLARSKGPEFDRLYVQAMRRDHESMMHLLQSSTDVSDPKLKSFIQETEPVVEHHLQMAMQLTGA